MPRIFSEQFSLLRFRVYPNLFPIVPLSCHGSMQATVGEYQCATGCSIHFCLELFNFYGDHISSLGLIKKGVRNSVWIRNVSELLYDTNFCISSFKSNIYREPALCQLLFWVLETRRWIKRIHRFYKVHSPWEECQPPLPQIGIYILRQQWRNEKQVRRCGWEGDKDLRQWMEPCGYPRECSRQRWQFYKGLEAGGHLAERPTWLERKELVTGK